MSDPGPLTREGKLGDQCRLQLRLDRRRRTLLIPVVFGFGLLASALLPTATVLRLRAGEALRVGDFLGALAFLYFAVPLVLGAFARPYRRPRLVPCFRSVLGPWGGPGSAAFRRGRALARELERLDALALSLGERPLSDFGFADEYYGQEVRWYEPATALRTVEALRAGPAADGGNGGGAPAGSAVEIARDLDALATALRTAADRGVELSLVVRPWPKDSLQVAATREDRAGRFW